MQKRPIVTCGLLIARRHPAKVLQAPKEALYFVSVFVEFAINLTRVFGIFAARNHRLRFERLNEGHQVVAVIAFIAQYGFDQLLNFWILAKGQERFGLWAIVGLAGRKDELQWVAEGIDERVDFGGEPAPAASESFGFDVAFFWPAACWWALTTVARGISHSRSGSCKASKWS